MDLILRPSNDRYEVVGGYKYRDIFVPDRFKTDGISAKIRLLYLFVNKYDPRVIEAVVVHDYLCEMEEYAKADRYFKELLPNIWQKKYMVGLVKMYHKYEYGV